MILAPQAFFNATASGAETISVLMYFFFGHADLSTSCDLSGAKHVEPRDCLVDPSGGLQEASAQWWHGCPASPECRTPVRIRIMVLGPMVLPASPSLAILAKVIAVFAFSALEEPPIS